LCLGPVVSQFLAVGAFRDLVAQIPKMATRLVGAASGSLAAQKIAASTAQRANCDLRRRGTQSQGDLLELAPLLGQSFFIFPRSFQGGDQSIEESLWRGPLPGDAESSGRWLPDPEDMSAGSLLAFIEERLGTECAKGTLDGVGVHFGGRSDGVGVHRIAFAFEYFDRRLENR
jgi:hypothetical protein